MLLAPAIIVSDRPRRVVPIPTKLASLGQIYSSRSLEPLSKDVNAGHANKAVIGFSLNMPSLIGRSSHSWQGVPLHRERLYIVDIVVEYGFGRP